MIAFAALVGLVVLIAVTGHDRLKVAIAAACVMFLMGGPIQFVHAAIAAVPGLGG